MKTLVFSVFILLGVLFFAGVFGMPVNKGIENAAISIGIPEINPLPEVADSQLIGVSGIAHAKSYVSLYVNGARVSEMQATSSAGGLGGEGAFAFEDVELAEGENVIYVVSSIGNGRNGIEVQSEPVAVWYQSYGKKIIGPDGGSVISRDLNLELAVPQGALQSKTLISIERAEAAPGEIEYELEPTGLVFLQPATARLALSDEEMSWFGPKLIKVYLETEGSEPELLPCTVDEETGIVIAEISHFSRVSIRAPLQFTDFQFKESERTWTEGGFIKTQKIKWVQNVDIAAGVGWWLSSLNLFKGVKKEIEYYKVFENFRGNCSQKEYTIPENYVLQPRSASEWNKDAFSKCDILDVWHWTEWFQCGSKGAAVNTFGAGYFYWHERWEYEYSHTLYWEYELKSKGRLKLLATTSDSGASAETITIDTIEFGQ